MKSENIVISGIQRAIPDSDAKPGACREIINSRFRKGCWRPIPAKKYYNDNTYLLDRDYHKIYFHSIENGLVPGEPNMIGLTYDYDQYEGNGLIRLYLINQFRIGIEINTNGGITADPSIPFTVVFLKRTMILTSSAGVKTFIWIDGSYNVLSSLPVPDVELTAFSSIQVNSSVTSGNNNDKKASTGEGLLGLFYKALNEESEINGRIFGSIMYITAYRLFDGSYIVPSVPKYLEINNGGAIYHENTVPADEVEGDLWWMRFYMSKVQATINNDLYPESIGSIKELVDSVCVFATKATTLHKLDETTVTDSLLLNQMGSPSNGGPFYFKDYFPISDDFKKLAKSSGWYNVIEFDFTDVVVKTGRTTKEIESKGFYQDYATRITLTTDQNSHHTLAAKFPYVYNDRLHLLNVKTILGSPYLYWPVSTIYTKYSTVAGKINVFLKTSTGNVVVSSNIDVPIYRESIPQSSVQPTMEAAEAFLLSLTSTEPDYIPESGYIEENYGIYVVNYWTFAGSNYEYYILPALVGYNDARAYKYEIVADLKLIFSDNLTKNSAMNFAFWNSPEFSANESNSTSNYKPITRLTSYYASSIYVESGVNESLNFDTNRLQVSEIQNPIVFPTKNSYQIGNGDCLAMAAGSDPLSDGQFGQFPLQVFSSDGSWALEVGTGDVLYTKIVPANKDVINNVNNVISVGIGVCYTTDNGLYIINGLKATELSEIVENDSSLLQLNTLSEITTLLTDSKFVPSLANSLSAVGFLEYLNDSTVGYDHINKELIVTNYNYSYSYLYSIENQVWYKLSHSYKSLINAYPKLLGVTDSNIVSLSEELSNVFTDTLFVTMAQNLDAKDVYKKIERAILRCRITSGVNKYPGFYVFASDDLLTWQLITGKQRTGTKLKDLLVQRSHGSAKAYMFVFAGNIGNQSEIKQIDLVYSPKLTNKLR